MTRRGTMLTERQYTFFLISLLGILLLYFGNSFVKDLRYPTFQATPGAQTSSLTGHQKNSPINKRIKALKSPIGISSPKLSKSDVQNLSDKSSAYKERTSMNNYETGKQSYLNQLRQSGVSKKYPVEKPMENVKEQMDVDKVLKDSGQESQTKENLIGDINDASDNSMKDQSIDDPYSKTNRKGQLKLAENTLEKTAREKSLHGNSIEEYEVADKKRPEVPIGEGPITDRGRHEINFKEQVATEYHKQEIPPKELSEQSAEDYFKQNVLIEEKQIKVQSILNGHGKEHEILDEPRPEIPSQEIVNNDRFEKKLSDKDTSVPESVIEIDTDGPPQRIALHGSSRQKQLKPEISMNEHFSRAHSVPEVPAKKHTILQRPTPQMLVKEHSKDEKPFPEEHRIEEYHLPRASINKNSLKHDPAPESPIAEFPNQEHPSIEKNMEELPNPKYSVLGTHDIDTFQSEPQFIGKNSSQQNIISQNSIQNRNVNVEHINPNMIKQQNSNKFQYQIENMEAEISTNEQAMRSSNSSEQLNQRDPNPRIWKFTKSTSEVRQVVFAKVHKAASSTVQNILLRFAMARNLSMILPYTPPIIDDRSSRITNIIPSPEGLDKSFDILCVHVIFNDTEISKYFHDSAVRVAILREPMEQSLSALAYYTTKYPTSRLKRGYMKFRSDPINGFLNNPEAFYDPYALGGPSLSYINNRMSMDLGFDLSGDFEQSKKNESKINAFLKQIENQFDLILISDYFDESMVLLSRYLHWSMKDILYIKRNSAQFDLKSVWSKKPVLAQSTSRIFRQWDYIDYQLYEHFLPIFLKKIERETLFKEEVQEYQRIRNDEPDFCNKNSNSVFKVPQSKWTEEFYISRENCRYMFKSEMEFVTEAKNAQLMRYYKHR